MAWTNLTFAFGSVLTSTKMTQMQDNFTALAQGHSGAPKVQTAALEQTSGSEAVTRDTIRAAAVGATEIDADAVGQSELAASAVGQGETKTSLQQNSALNTAVSILMTGGTYTLAVFCAVNGATPVFAGASTSGYTTTRAFTWDSTNRTYYVQARYFTASPPYDLGDGEIPLFVFVEINPAGDVVRVDVAPDPPWAYNGPTDIRPSRKTKDGRKFRRVREIIAEFGSIDAARLALPRAQFVQRLMTDALVEQEITQAIKQADMPLIPHPFVVQPPAPGNTIALLDGQSPMMARLLALHEELNPGDTLSDLLRGGYIRVDNVPLARRGPPGVITVAPRWNLTP